MVAQIDEKLMVIFGRRSIRINTPGEVNEAVVQKLLAGAMAAPSASGITLAHVGDIALWGNARDCRSWHRGLR